MSPLEAERVSNSEIEHRQPEAGRNRGMAEEASAE